MTKVATELAPVDLFRGFLAIGLMGFGGVLPFARRELVEHRGWLSASDFNERLALCQSLPGPNIVNLSVMLGAERAGWPGAIAAFSGLLAGPAILAVGAYRAWTFWAPPVIGGGVMRGLAAGAAGLVIAMAARMFQAGGGFRRPLTALPAVLAFAGVIALRLPLPALVAALTPLGWLVTGEASDEGR